VYAFAVFHKCKVSTYIITDIYTYLHTRRGKLSRPKHKKCREGAEGEAEDRADVDNFAAQRRDLFRLVFAVARLAEPKFAKFV